MAVFLPPPGNEREKNNFDNLGRDAFFFCPSVELSFYTVLLIRNGNHRFTLQRDMQPRYEFRFLITFAILFKLTRRLGRQFYEVFHWTYSSLGDSESAASGVVRR